VLPACAPGTLIEGLSAANGSLPVSVSAPVFRVIKSREPDARRVQYRRGLRPDVASYEALLLPFGETVAGVRLIAGIFDFDLSEHTGAFR
jgi:hypothetical protein